MTDVVIRTTRRWVYAGVMVDAPYPDPSGALDELGRPKMLPRQLFTPMAMRRRDTNKYDWRQCRLEGKR